MWLVEAPGELREREVEVLDDLAADRALEGEVELLEGLAGGEARRLDPALAAVALPG